MSGLSLLSPLIAFGILVLATWWTGTVVWAE